MATDLRVGNRASVAAFAQAVHFVKAQMRQLRGSLLSGVQTKAAQETRQTNQARPDVSEAKKQIPIEREVKAFVKCPSDLVPYAPSPKKRLLGHVIGPRQNIIIMGRQNPTA